MDIKTYRKFEYTILDGNEIEILKYRGDSEEIIIPWMGGKTTIKARRL